MAEAEKSESRSQVDCSMIVATDEAMPSCDTQVSVMMRGKGKLSCIFDEVEALKKKVKIEPSNIHALNEIPASPDKTDPMIESPLATPVSAKHSPETIRRKRALKSLSLYLSEFEFCEGSSDRSDDIAESLAEFVVNGALDIDYDLLVKKNIFASFQALHLSSDIARARQHSKLTEKSIGEELSEQKFISLETGKALDHGKARHADTLIKLQEARAELQVVKNSMQSLDEKMIQMLGKMDVQEKESKDVVMQYMLLTRIGMLLEPLENRASWNVQDEINAFRLKFTDCDLNEWDVPEDNNDLSKSV